MAIVFTKSANGEATCTCNSIRIHSAYNPSQEALRFVQSIKCDFEPGYIMMTGPGLSYTAVYLRKIFPCTKIVALHYATEFSVTEKLWDKCFYYTGAFLCPSRYSTIWAKKGSRAASSSPGSPPMTRSPKSPGTAGSRYGLRS